MAIIDQANFNPYTGRVLLAVIAVAKLIGLPKENNMKPVRSPPVTVPIKAAASISGFDEITDGDLPHDSTMLRTDAEEAMAQISSGRQLAEDALRESEERYRMLLDGIQDYAIFIMDTHGRIVSWNTGAERIKGYKATQIIGKNFSCL